MWRGIAIAQAVIVIGAATAAGIYTETGLLPMFSRFGQDTHNAIFYGTNMRGDPFFVFEDQYGNAARWERHGSERWGNTAGEVFVEGRRFEFARDNTVTTSTGNGGGGYEAYALAQSMRVWVTGDSIVELNFSFRDSTFAKESGTLTLIFDRDCEAEASVPIRGRPPTTKPFAMYRAKIEKADSTGFVPHLDDIFDTASYSNFILPPGAYRLWAAPIDSLGMQGHFIGPVELQNGQACP